MRDRAARTREYLTAARRREELRTRALVVTAARTIATAVSPRARAADALLAAAGEQVTAVELARRATCSVSTIGRAKRDMVREGLVNAHAPAPIRDRAGRCVGRDSRGGVMYLALRSRAAIAVAVAAGVRRPNRSPARSSTKSGLCEMSHLHLFTLPDGKPAARPVRQNN